MLDKEIFPQLKHQLRDRVSKEMLERDSSLAIFTVVFDREGV